MKINIMKIRILGLIGLLLITLQACYENNLGPIENDNQKPGPVSNVKVENLPGAAKISYTLPNDNDLAYVRAVYTTEDGRIREFKSSYYNTALDVEGFATENVYEVNLYAVC